MMLNIRCVGVFLLILLIAGCKPEDRDPLKYSTKAQRIEHAFEDDFMRTFDPALGYPPKERMVAALREIRNLQEDLAQRRGATQGSARFIERGPDNVGGRTRAMMIDIRDPERKTLWAGSVAGGLWKTEDITANPPQWRTADDYLDNLAVGALAQDPFDPEIMYMGTGEGFNNFDAVRGIGIFKSVDGGDSWFLLPSTDNPQFRFTRDLLIHPGTGHLYAATRDAGVLRSEDGGESWLRVLGVSIGSLSDNMFDLIYAQGRIFASSLSSVHMSTTGNRGAWQNITLPASNFPSSLSRVEIAVCPSNADLIYAVGSQGGSASNIFRTTNGGQSWASLDRPTGGDFTFGQAWYDLEIEVDPFECNHVIVGGVGIFRSLNGGNSWNSFLGSMHVDQHKNIFDPEQPGVVYFANDGGVYRSDNGSHVTARSKNQGYITTQYYGGAIHPHAFSDYLLGGTQDNGTHQLTEPGLGFGRRVWGGDGFLCHIDSEDPSYQMVSSQFGNWGLSTNGGQTFSGGTNVSGRFLTPSDYDSRTKILYTQTANGDFARWHILTNVVDSVQVSNLNVNPYLIRVDRNVDNRVYFGTLGGQVIRVDNAHEGKSVTGTLIHSSTGTVSGIDIMHNEPDRIIVTRSNYGINSIHVTDDGGMSWTVCQGNLPDMPVRSVVFNPRNRDQAMIATEAGVWNTLMLDGPNTIWIPPMPGRGTPLTRTDELKIRLSDNVVLAATHGRGLWTSSTYADPVARMSVPLVHYVNAPVHFVGSISYNADDYQWTFGDGQSSTLEDPVHYYTQIGTYPFNLAINQGMQSISDAIKILPDVQLPYTKDRPYYGGSFENHPEQYGVHTLSGSSFERGNSQFSGKNGTRSGDHAFVIGLNEQHYQPNSHTYLYLPVFDFSDESIYTLSFWARYFLHPGPDGFLVEFTTNRGESWQILGSASDQRWYNHTASSTSAFPEGTPYFTGEVGGYTNYTYDLSFLSGHKDVAFRFLFRSEGTGSHIGLAIDDVEIFKYEGPLETMLTHFSGRFGLNVEVILDWTTRPEYHCRRFEIQRSDNGRDFTTVDVVHSKSGLTANVTEYTHTTIGNRDFYFYRLKVINEDAASEYYYEFYSDVITVSRLSEQPVGLYRIFPNPFTDAVNLTFTRPVEQNVLFEIFDAAGRQLHTSQAFISNAYHALTLSRWPAGVYYLSVKIGDGKATVYPLIANGG